MKKQTNKNTENKGEGAKYSRKTILPKELRINYKVRIGNKL